MYYDDFKIEVSVEHIFTKSQYFRFLTESNSLEFIRSGHIRLEHQENGVVTDLKAPAVFWMHGNHHYKYIRSGKKGQEDPVDHIYIDFTGKRSDKIVAALDELYPSGTFQPADPEETNKCFVRLLHLYRIGGEKKIPETGFQLEKLMFMAYQSSQYGNKGPEDLYGLAKIEERFKSEPFQDYDFHKIAEEMNISYDHFRKIFRKRCKASPFAYLHRQKMIRIAELLEKTDIRIKEMVNSCNFHSLIEFSRMFKKFSGYSPREYRKKFR